MLARCVNPDTTQRDTYWCDSVATIHFCVFGVVAKHHRVAYWRRKNTVTTMQYVVVTLIPVAIVSVSTPVLASAVVCTQTPYDLCHLYLEGKMQSDLFKRINGGTTVKRNHSVMTEEEEDSESDV